MNPPKVFLSVNHYRDELKLFISFEYNTLLIDRVKQLPQVQWSSYHRSWYIPYQNDSKALVEQVLGQLARIDFPGLRSMPLAPEPVGLDLLLPEEYIPYDLASGIKKFQDYLRARRYSDNTIKTYSEALRTFFVFLKLKPVEYISNADLLRFHNEYILARNLSASYQNQAINAVKLFFSKLASRHLHVELVTRPKREKRLPNVLSKEEVKRILEAPVNLKHRAMLSLIYACGLRCGELLNLLPVHVDSNRNLLLIKQAKGKKDRIVPLSLKLLELLREYFIRYRPKVYLFEGQKPGTRYDERSLQTVLKNAITKIGLRKPVTLHWLRHSYATHLLEAGTDIRYIQEILGHQSSKTTDIYTHVSNKSIQKITSPFDQL